MGFIYFRLFICCEDGFLDCCGVGVGVLCFVFCSGVEIGVVMYNWFIEFGIILFYCLVGGKEMV